MRRFNLIFALPSRFCETLHDLSGGASFSGGWEDVHI